jgi:4'-phosphopantetheinyl transferase
LPDASGLSFNVSHAGDHALIALSRVREVGIDIEQHNASIDWRGLARLVCTPAERQALDSAPPPSQAALFMRCWTAKEALLKTLGLGIAHGLQALSVDLAGGCGVDAAASPEVVGSAVEFGAASQLQYRWLDDVPGYACCLAFAKPDGIA